MSYSHRYSLHCPDCKADLTQPGAVDVHYVVDHAEFDIPSKLDETGLLEDNEGLIAIGKHGGVVCMACSEQLDELEWGANQADQEEVEGDSWYIRYEGTGEISGPMSQDDALTKAGQTDGMVFSSAIFSSTHIAEALQKLLSSELSKDRTEMIRLLRKMAKDEWGHVSVAADREVPAPEDLQLLHKAAEALLFLSSKRLVYIDVRGGVADVEGLPDGVEVIIDDYDVEGSDAELSENPDTGEAYHRREFGNKGT